MMPLEYLIDAFYIAIQPVNLLALLLSVFFGLLAGILPGLTATMVIALLIGLTYGLGTQTAIICLLGVYVGAISAGCQTAILLNIPGVPASAATAQDGFAMGKKGEAGYAIFLATSASFCGTVISVLFLLLLTPLLSDAALKFGSWEFFLLAFFGILICGNLSSKENVVKGWIAGILGLLVSQIGIDPVNGYHRFSYGNNNLMAGIALVPVMIGLFGFPEVLNMFKEDVLRSTKMTVFRIKEGFVTMGKNTVNVIRSGLIGVGVGIIPGVGEDIGGWLSYWAAKTASSDKEKFGKGAPEGVIAAEAGSNACIGGSIIPVLSLAVPGSTSAAVLLAAFLLHGYRPGPLLMIESPQFLYQVCMYLMMASFAMWVLALIIARFTVKILSVKKNILMPVIFTICIIGSYLINNNMFDVKVMFIFGVLGFLMAKMDYPPAPMLLGVVLGPMMDSNIKRALTISDGSLLPIFTRPISLVFFIMIVLLIMSQFDVFSKLKNKIFRRNQQ
jgi:putative tricarboxylic transport membrane protein